MCASDVFIREQTWHGEMDSLHEIGEISPSSEIDTLIGALKLLGNTFPLACTSCAVFIRDVTDPVFYSVSSRKSRAVPTIWIYISCPGDYGESDWISGTFSHLDIEWLSIFIGFLRFTS